LGTLSQPGVTGVKSFSFAEAFVGGIRVEPAGRLPEPLNLCFAERCFGAGRKSALFKLYLLPAGGS